MQIVYQHKSTVFLPSNISGRIHAKMQHVCATHDSSVGLSNAKCSQVIPHTHGRFAPGFTLLELMTVMTLILVLASISVPTYHAAIVRAHEAGRRDDLYTLRNLIDRYT